MANARIALISALTKVMVDMFSDETALAKQFFDNPEFQHWLTETIFRNTYDHRQGSVHS